MRKSGWDQVEAEVNQVLALNPDPFDSRTIANVGDLLEVCRAGVALPTDVCKGYWTTVRFLWSGSEIEVYEDRLEVYRFLESRFHVWYEEHVAGEPFTQKFLDTLKTFVTE
ncbi:hypothetical protein SAMN05421770_101405 [Granulicella rosea]|uniref:Uncharacterized protein n=1 Tax=Granulicella rosea TaxID=474952 RepID=A0A239DCU5_9BACT|nr:hypothetical protein [Granulicella rosea]SNS30149.1 hypothetical protein SAMN05421770_101405 [Granulicella rosea]